MPVNIPNQKLNNETNMQENSLEKNQQLQYLLFWLFPFWSWIALALVIDYTTGASQYVAFATFGITLLLHFISLKK